MSLARFTAWMHTSNAERRPSRPFCGWDVEAIVEVCDRCGKDGCVGYRLRGRTRTNPNQQRRPRSPCYSSSFFATKTPTLPRQSHSDETLSSRITLPALLAHRKTAPQHSFTYRFVRGGRARRQTPGFFQLRKQFIRE